MELPNLLFSVINVLTNSPKTGGCLLLIWKVLTQATRMRIWDAGRRICFEGRAFLSFTIDIKPGSLR